MVGVISNSYGSWPLHIAKELKFFQADLDVEVRITGSSVEHLRLLEEGGLNIGHQAADHVIRSVQRGSDLRMILGVNRPALSLIVQPTVKSFSDLHSKRLGVDGVSTGYALLLKEMLRRNSLTNDDYSLIPVGSSQKRLEALTGGTVDGTLLDPPYDLNALDVGYRSLGRTIDYFPTFQGSVLAAKMSWAQQNSELVISFIQAYLQSLDWMRHHENRDAAAKCLASALHLRIDTAARVYSEYVAQNCVFCESGCIEHEALREVVALMPDTSVEISSVVELLYLKEALRRLPAH